MSIVELVEKTPKKEACQLVQFGGNGVETRMLCGAFQFSALRDGFLKPILPETIILSYRANESHNLLESTLRLILIEASHNLPGAEMILSNLVGILLVQVLRAWIDRKAATQKTHWLKALKDKRIATALSCIHTQPEYKWTVAKLAASANMSRSPFAARFKLLVGETPMSYLGKWRMIRATRMLEDTNLGLSEIASSVGYQSMPSFSKTFKKITGYAPGQWRAKTPSVTDGAIINYHPFDER